ncbi:Rib/alpha-like domain-containing protein [Corynebacterium auris]|uniref:Rib/alpha-like domain-containing protein n=1 Tax=Corynebacterium auris TaxID=44750 RepID=UPI0025B3A9A2|nr:Rib/alpha-like domain-containing protein [Corynebacterium auris]WJY68866.1 C protein alpha-antigen precursor [Corynebacterium auris]
MSTHNFARRRGTSIAAAALSLALVAPFVPAVANPTLASTAVAQTAAQPAPPVPSASAIIPADGIANGYVRNDTGMSNAYATLSGTVGYAETVASSSLPGAGINGVTVYMQFRDSDGQVSPVFSAETHSIGNGNNGRYVFDLRAKDANGNPRTHPDAPGSGREYSFIDANGKPHIFNAGPGQAYRLWLDPEDAKNHETGNDLIYFRQAGGPLPGQWREVFDAANPSAQGSFVFTGINMQRTGIFLYEQPPSVAENSYMVARDGAGNLNVTRDSGGVISNPAVNPFVSNSISGNVFLESFEVYGDRTSVGAPGRNRGDTPRAGYTVYASQLSGEAAARYSEIDRLPAQNQAAATKRLFEEMRANGREPIDRTVSAVTDANGDYSIRMGDGFNRNRMYMWVEDPEGNVISGYSAWPTPVFQAYNSNAGENPGIVPGWNPLPNNVYNMRFAESAHYPLQLDITNYDNLQNPASPGSVAELNLTGRLPLFPGNTIVWRTPGSTQALKTCEVRAPGVQPGCTFTVPDDARPGQVYEAVFIAGNGVEMASDTFVVRGQNPKATYQPATFPEGEGGVVPAPTFTEAASGEEVEAPEGVTYYQSEDVPDWATVNTDGTITITPDAPVGEHKIPVVIEYSDGERDTVFATVVVDGAPTDPSALNYPALTTTPGTPVSTGEPTLPEGVVKPEGATFRFPAELPAGWERDAENPNRIINRGANPDDASDDIVAELDSVEGQVTVTPGANAAVNPAGNEAPEVSLPVELADGNGAVVAKGNVVVDLTAPVAAPDWNDGSVKPGGSAELPNQGGPVPDGAEIVIRGPGSAKIDNEGNLVVTPSEGAKPGDKITVEVRDPEGNVLDTVVVEVAPSDADVNNPGYGPGSGLPGSEVKLPQTGDPELPEGTQFATESPSFSVDANTGEVTVQVPEGAEPGSELSGTVVVTYPDGSKDEVEVTVTVTAPVAAPDWNDGSVKPGGSAELPNQGGPVPDGAEIVIRGPGSAKIDNEGNLVVTPSEGAKPGDKITVEVRDPEGNVLDTVVVEVAPSDADVNNPGYGPGSGLPGSEVKLPQTGDPELPEGTQFATESPSFSVDANTGEVTVQVPEGAEPGSELSGTVVVTYPDGSKDEVEVTVTVTAPVAAPDWNDGSVKPGGSAELPNQGGPVPDGAEIVIRGPGSAKIDNEGNLVVTPSEGAKPGDKITVEVRDPEGNVLDTVVVEVAPSDADVNNPGYGPGSGLPGSEVKLPQTGDPELPEGTQFATESPSFSVDANTGEVTVQVPEGAEPGSELSGTVVVTYPDGSKDEVEVTVTVTAPVAAPDWNDGSVKPGGSVELPNQGGPVPDGAEIVIRGPGSAKIDNEGNLVVTPSEGAKPGDKITVEVRDPEGNVLDTVVVEVAQRDGGSSLDEDERNRCIATSVGFGVPLLALIPLGLASQLAIPGLEPFFEQARTQIRDFNTAVQQQANIFHPGLAQQVERIDAQLARFNLNLGSAAATLAGVAAVVLAGLAIADACTPGGTSTAGSSAGSSSLGSSAGDSAEGAMDEGSSSLES